MISTFIGTDEPLDGHCLTESELYGNRKYVHIFWISDEYFDL